MNFLWDIVLRAQSCGKREEELFFVQAKEYSPFYEQSFPCLNESQIESKEIELNLLYRFADIFQDFLAEEREELQEFKRYVTDAILHILLYTDLRHGLSAREIYIRKLTQELLNGDFWKSGVREFQLISSPKQKRLATLVLSQMQTGSSLLIFRRSVLILFSEAILYQVKADRKKLLLYLPDKETEEKQRMLQFVQDMFLPLSYNIRAFWEHHFGIMGVESTMNMDEIAIY